MLTKGLEQFGGKRVLLLQGPVGPFFRRLAADLRAVGAQVHKANFNAGDWFFYPRGAIQYRGTVDAWPAYVEALIGRLRIDVVLLFGDCRPVHQMAHAVASRLGIEIGVFEEGYLRPDFITLESFGVNGFSLLPDEPEHYQSKPPKRPSHQAVGNAYWHMVWCGLLYFTAGALGKPLFWHYQHHRPLSLLEGLPWLRSVWRKQWYGWTERGLVEVLTDQWSKEYFLVPLQVFNDAQIVVHAEWESVQQFIEATLRSFALHAPPGMLLVFKHHPMDRGYQDYGRFIRRLVRKAKLGNRVLYIHDQHLPTLLEHARGVVLINSTVGMSALHHGAPTKVCGSGLYDIPGLTYQGPLDRFWADAPAHPPQRDLFQNFKEHLIARTQINGSFYKPMQITGSHTGVVWQASGMDAPVRTKARVPMPVPPMPTLMPSPLWAAVPARSPFIHTTTTPVDGISRHWPPRTQATAAIAGYSMSMQCRPKAPARRSEK